MPQERWAMSLGCLLEDRDGVDAFRKYLDEFDQRGAHFLKMWLVFNGLDKQYAEKKTHSPDQLVGWLIKVTEKLLQTFFPEGNSAAFHGQQIRSLAERLQRTRSPAESFKIAESLKRAFDASQMEVKNTLDSNQYRNFINSKVYQEYSGRFSEEPSLAYSSRYMPTLPENKVIIIIIRVQ